MAFGGRCRRSECLDILPVDYTNCPLILAQDHNTLLDFGRYVANCLCLVFAIDLSLFSRSHLVCLFFRI